MVAVSGLIVIEASAAGVTVRMAVVGEGAVGAGHRVGARDVVEPQSARVHVPSGLMVKVVSAVTLPMAVAEGVEALGRVGLGVTRGDRGRVAG